MGVGITTTIISPTALIAANFVVLGNIIQRIGQDYSWLSSKWCEYSMIFLACDIIALILEALGVRKGQDPSPGANIMLAGVCFQLAALVIYVTLASEFLLCHAYDHPGPNEPLRAAPFERNIKLIITGLGLEAVFLSIRSIHRTAILSDGWKGKIITTQVYFNVFDAAVIMLAMFTLNFFHPGQLRGHAKTWEAGYVPRAVDVESHRLKKISK
ncbi:hypothetical protein BV20DRAFT_1053340 [Pilatotrama ljubarskyi]|nr:hypothetical protein BV20DRAFT_1053340 [Pilatotrama ljubarskyi]